MLESPRTTPDGRAEHRGARVAGAALLLVAAGIHVAELPGTDVPALVVGFALSALATLAAAVLLLTRGPRLGWLFGATAAALTFLGYVLSRWTGIPGDHEDVGNWGEPLGVLSLVVEALVVALAVWALADGERVSRRIVREELTAVTPAVVPGHRP